MQMARFNNLDAKMNATDLAKAPATPTKDQLVQMDEMTDDDIDALFAGMTEKDVLDLACDPFGGAYGAAWDEICDNIDNNFDLVHAVAPVNPAALPAIQSTTPPPAAVDIGTAPVYTLQNIDNFVHAVEPVNQPAVQAIQSANPPPIVLIAEVLAVNNIPVQLHANNIEPMEVGDVEVDVLVPLQPLQWIVATALHPKGKKVAKYFKMYDNDDTEDYEVEALYIGSVVGYDVEEGWWLVKWEDGMYSDETEEEMAEIVALYHELFGDT